jgi:hypothetical protein
MAPLPAPTILWAASAPLSVARLERYSQCAGAASFPRQPLALSWPGAGGGKQALRHNKRMHATAHTKVLINLARGGA